MYVIEAVIETQDGEDKEDSDDSTADTSKASETEDTSDSPKTGDETSLLIWCVLAAASLLILSMRYAARRKNGQES